MMMMVASVHALCIQGRSYMYAKSQVRTHMDRNKGGLNHNSDGLLMLSWLCRVQNHMRRTNFSNSLNPILTEFVILVTTL